MSATSRLFSFMGMRAVAALARQKIEMLLRAERRFREAQNLSRLDSRMLKDIGITRAQAEAEIRRMRRFSVSDPSCEASGR